MPVILVLIDALRYDYISEDRTPFLFHCAKNGEYYKRVIPSYGFCERTEILSGLEPAESGYFTAIGYDPTQSPYLEKRKYKIFDIIENYIPVKLYNPFRKRYHNIRKKFRNMVSTKIFLTKKISTPLRPYNIPFSYLPYFTLTEDGNNNSESSVSSKRSILTLLKNKNQKYFIDSFTSLNSNTNYSDKERFELSLQAIKNDDYVLHLVYNSIPDHYGHLYGTDSIELNDALNKLDGMIKKYVEACIEVNSSTSFIFLGDHGMVDMKDKIDIGALVKAISQKHKLRKRTDYVHFLDSTIFRIWFHSDKAKTVFQKELLNSPQLKKYGLFLTKSIANKYNIPFDDRRYGDLMWLANSGVIIYPDFFHSDFLNKGMHGYDPENLKCQGTCIVFGHNISPKNVDAIKLTEVYSILKHQLRLDN